MRAKAQEKNALGKQISDRQTQCMTQIPSIAVVYIQEDWESDGSAWARGTNSPCDQHSFHLVGEATNLQDKSHVKLFFEIPCVACLRFNPGSLGNYTDWRMPAKAVCLTLAMPVIAVLERTSLISEIFSAHIIHDCFPERQHPQHTHTHTHTILSVPPCAKRANAFVVPAEFSRHAAKTVHQFPRATTLTFTLLLDYVSDIHALQTRA